MVKIQRLKANRRFSCTVLTSLILLFVLTFALLSNAVIRRKARLPLEEKSEVGLQGDKKSGQQRAASISCEYKSLSDLKDYESYPQVSELVDGNKRRHAYEPPKDGFVTLVCCDTTAGPLSVAVHENWAPLGAERFLDMVKDNYFSSKVALMRCVRNFICQFGIAGNPDLNRKYGSFSDDKQWLKEGPSYRTNKYGSFRFARGYFAYAGSGKNSRGNQLIVALGDNKFLGGGSPWEVPFGEVVGAQSYDTLAKISTVYGEKGPSQGLLHREGSSAHVAELFPELDYVSQCVVVDRVNMTRAN